MYKFSNTRFVTNCNYLIDFTDNMWVVHHDAGSDSTRWTCDTFNQVVESIKQHSENSKLNIDPEVKDAVFNLELNRELSK